MIDRLPLLTGAMLFLFLLTTAVLVTILSSFTFQRRNRVRTRLILLTMFVVNYLSLMHLFLQRPWEERARWPFSLDVPWELRGSAAIATVCYLVWIIRSEFIFRKNQLSPASIKESMDSLPDGVLFATQEGRVLLANEAMLRIGQQLLGRRIVNASEFWKSVAGEAGTEETIVTLPDETIRRFRRVELMTEERPLVRITATDLTDLYHLTEELRQRNRELTKMNERLRQYRVHVDVYTREKEHLQIKTRIHREIGQLLLVTRHAIMAENEDTLRSVLRGWKLLETSMRDEPETEWSSQAKQQLLKAAEAAGAELTISGEFPKEKEIISLLMGACAEATINAVRHAEAKHVAMKISAERSEYYVCFTNDGRRPEGNIEPAGGLDSLKGSVEAMGGAMELRSEPEFQLILKIPRIE